MRPVNLLSSDVNLLDVKVEFLGISGIYYINFAMVIRPILVVMAILTIVAILVIKLSWLTVLALETIITIKIVMAIMTNIAFFDLLGLELGIKWKKRILE